jgi:hypothetical protein
MRQLSILLNRRQSRATQCDIFRRRTQVALDLGQISLKRCAVVLGISDAKHLPARDVM